MAGPDIWGPPGWKFIHFVTMGYPDYPTQSIKKKYYDYFNSLQHVLPCSICVSHFSENLKNVPLDDTALSNRTNLIKWGINIHNLVNKQNGKKKYTYVEAIKEILKPNNKTIEIYKTKEQLTNNNNYGVNPIFFIISIALNIFLIFVFIINRYKK